MKVRSILQLPWFSYFHIEIKVRSALQRDERPNYVTQAMLCVYMYTHLMHTYVYNMIIYYVYVHVYVCLYMYIYIYICIYVYMYIY